MDDAQVQAMVQQWRDRVAKQLDEMKVRQWCVEQAIKALDGKELPPPFMATGGALPDAGDPGMPTHYIEDAPEPKVEFVTVALSRQIFEFITAPFAELFTEGTSEDTGSATADDNGRRVTGL